MLEAQPILPLADAVAAHDTATGAATDTIWSAWPVSGRAGAAAWAWLNDLRVLHSDLVWADEQLRVPHGEQLNRLDRDPEPAVSAVTAAMIRHVQVRGSDRRIRPLAPDAHRALTAYLAERMPGRRQDPARKMPQDQETCCPTQVARGDLQARGRHEISEDQHQTTYQPRDDVGLQRSKTKLPNLRRQDQTESNDEERVDGIAQK